MSMTQPRAVWRVGENGDFVTLDARRGPTFTPGQGTVDGSRMLRVIDAQNHNWYRLDARHLTGPNGTVASITWSNALVAPQRLEVNGLEMTRLISAPAGITTVSCTITDDAGGTATFSRELCGYPQEHQVSYSSRQYTTPGMTGQRFEIKPRALPGMDYVIGGWEPVQAPGMTSPPPLYAVTDIVELGGQNVQVLSFAPGTSSITVPMETDLAKPAGEGRLCVARVGFDVPASVPGPVTFCYTARIWLPSRPDIPAGTTSLMMVHVTPETPAATSTSVKTPFPRGHVSRCDVQRLPNDPDTDLVATEWNKKIGSGGGIAAAASGIRSNSMPSSIYRVNSSTGAAEFDVINVRGLNYQRKGAADWTATLDANGNIVTGLPLPKGAIPSRGTDNNIHVYDEHTDTEYSCWLTHPRPLGCDGDSRWTATQRTAADGDGCSWWATAGGKTANLSKSGSGQLSGTHHVSASGISLMSMTLMCDEALAARTKYVANDPTWVDEIDHVLYMTYPGLRSWPAYSWPANSTDGGWYSAAYSPMAGQIVTIHPNLDLSTLSWGANIGGRIVAEAIKRRGAVFGDTNYGLIPEIGHQNGIPIARRTGVDPWSTFYAGLTSPYAILDPLPKAFVDPTDGLTKNVWVFKKDFLGKSTFDADYAAGHYHAAAFGSALAHSSTSLVGGLNWRVDLSGPTGALKEVRAHATDANRHVFVVGESGAPADPGSATTQRAELEGNSVTLAFDTTYWWSFAVRLHGPTPSGGWAVIAQVHQRPDAGDYNGSPPFALNWLTNGTLELARRFDTAAVQTSTSPTVSYTNLGAFEPGVWHNVVLRLRFSKGAATGSVGIWIDGVSKHDNDAVAIGYNDTAGPYPKYGIYRAIGNGINVAEFGNVEYGTASLSGRIATPLAAPVGDGAG